MTSNLPFQGNYTKCFERLGTPLTNPRFWSARNGDVVTISFWDDPGNFSNGRYHRRPLDAAGRKKPAYKVENKHIEYAIQHTDGVVSVVLCHAKDSTAKVRSISGKCRAMSLRYRITEFDGDTGEFWAEPV